MTGISFYLALAVVVLIAVLGVHAYLFHRVKKFAQRNSDEQLRRQEADAVTGR